MTAIDLIPEAIHHQRRQRRRRLHWMQLAVAVVAAVILVGLFGEQEAQRARATLLHMQGLAGKTKALRKENDQIKKRVETMNAKLADARRLLGVNQWSRPLRHIARCVPDTVMLTAVHTIPQGPRGGSVFKRSSRNRDNKEDDTPPPQIKIQGVALSQSAVASMIESLKSEEIFPRVLLENTRRDGAQGSGHTEFTLICEW